MGVKDFVQKNFLILGLLAVICFGIIFPEPGKFLESVRFHGFTVPNLAIIIIFVVSGLCLASASDALQPKALTLGVILVLGITPLVAIPVLAIGKLNPNLNYKLLQGMALFTLVPTTLSSGVTMITQAKGNVSLAVLLTSMTNIMGIFTMPWSASWVFATNVSINPLHMLFELVWLTLVPLCIGMGLRSFVPALKAFATDNKKAMGLSQNCCILLVVLLMVSNAQSSIVSASPSDLSLCLSLAAGVHLVYRVLGYFVATAARLPPPEWVSIVLMCSQKSLPVCVCVLVALPPTFRHDFGLYILPCIMAHAAQLIIDSILAVRWQIDDSASVSKEALLSNEI